MSTPFRSKTVYIIKNETHQTINLVLAHNPQSKEGISFLKQAELSSRLEPLPKPRFSSPSKKLQSPQARFSCSLKYDVNKSRDAFSSLFKIIELSFRKSKILDNKNIKKIVKMIKVGVINKTILGPKRFLAINKNPPTTMSIVEEVVQKDLKIRKQ